MQFAFVGLRSCLKGALRPCCPFECRAAVCVLRCALDPLSLRNYARDQLSDHALVCFSLPHVLHVLRGRGRLSSLCRLGSFSDIAARCSLPVLCFLRCCKIAPCSDNNDRARHHSSQVPRFPKIPNSCLLCTRNFDRGTIERKRRNPLSMGSCLIPDRKRAHASGRGYLTSRPYFRVHARRRPLCDLQTPMTETRDT